MHFQGSWLDCAALVPPYVDLPRNLAKPAVRRPSHFFNGLLPHGRSQDHFGRQKKTPAPRVIITEDGVIDGPPYCACLLNVNPLRNQPVGSLRAWKPAGPK